MWKKISDKYEASSDGHIRNAKTKKILKEFKGADGYLRTQFDGKTQSVHRTIAKTFIPKMDGKDFVNHIDGNKTNNRIENLEWCTRNENMLHAYEHELKRRPIGELNSRCKLSKKDVDYILSKYIPGNSEYSAKALAKKFKVAPQTISAVITGQNWGTITNRQREV